MKKVIVGFGILVGLLLVAMLAIPLFVDVDQYRPQIVKLVNEKINGKFDLGKLSLKVWGTLRVDVAGLSLQDAKGRTVVGVKEAAVRIPWSSVLSGAPLLTFAMNEPEVTIVKDANGKLNVMSLMKEDAAAASAGTTGAPSSGDAAHPGGQQKIPAIVSNARLGLDLTDAHLVYVDEAMKSKTETKDLDFRVKDLSLSRTTEMELSGVLSSQQDKVFRVTGPFKVTAKASPTVEGGKLKRAAIEFEANFDDLDVEAGGAFHKKKGVTAKIDGAATLTPEDMEVSKLTAKFFNVVVDAKMKLTKLAADATGKVNPVVDLSLKSNEIDLKPWNELVPMLKDYDLSGQASLSANASGPADKLQYGADLGVRGMKLKNPMLKAEPELNASVKIATDKVEKMLVTMKAPGNDVTVEGSLVSFTAPRIQLAATSTSLDLDQLVQFPAKGADGKAAPAKAAGGKDGEAKPAAKEDLDKLLDPLRKNDMMANLTAVASVNAKLVKFSGVRMTDVAAKMSMKGLNASIDSASLRLFDGSVSAKGGTNMRPEHPTYSFSLAAAGVDLQKGVESQVAMLKNTIVGKASLKMDGNGSSYNPDAAMRNLNAKGTLRVEHAKFATIDIAKMVNEGLGKALDKVGDKVPGLKGKKLQVPNRDSRYEYVSSDFTISGGKFVSPNFQAKAEKEQGFDIKGSTAVGLLDQELKADWEVFDTYDMTKARNVDADVAGVNIPHILAEGDKPVTMPISIGCKYTDPCPSYGAIPEHFAKVALGNAKTGATKAVQNEAKAKAQDVGKKILKGLFK